MTDVSDGLLADLGHIATASNVMIDLSGAALRADVDAVEAAAAAAGADPWSLVLSGGRGPRAGGMFPGPGAGRLAGRSARVREGPPGVVVDGRQWTGPAGWQSFD